MNIYQLWGIGISLVIHFLLFASGTPVFGLSRSVFRQTSKRASRFLAIDPQNISKIKKVVKPLLTSKDIASFPDENPVQYPPFYTENIMKTLMSGKKKLSAAVKPQITEESVKKATLANIPTDSGEEKIPGYMEYYVHILKRLDSEINNFYQNYHTRESGNIFLTITVLNNGSLGTVNLKNSSTDIPALQEIAFNGIKNAAPFDSFPVEFKGYRNLKFNIAVYFKSN